MKIAIDARELLGQPTGVGRYLAGLLDAWTTLPAAQAHDFILCAPEPVDARFVRGRRLEVATGTGTWWEQVVLPRLVRQSRADLLFAPAYTAPLLLSVPIVVTIHDVSFAAQPAWFPRREGWRRRTLTRLSAHRAARVLTVSEFSKDEIARRLGIDPQHIDVVYTGIARSAAEIPIRRSVSPSTVLYVGSLFSRRHIPELISGFAALARRTSGLQLEVVGDNRTTPRVDFDTLVTASGMKDRIRFRSFVSDRELTMLYESAAAFVFLSSYEGFGLTPLEALAEGVPIVVLDTPVSREIYGDAALYVSRPDPILIERALERALTDERERARIIEAGRTVLARYSWSTCAADVLDTLVRAAR